MVVMDDTLPPTSPPEELTPLRALLAPQEATLAQHQTTIATLTRPRDEYDLEKLRREVRLAKALQQVYGPRADRISDPAQRVLEFGRQWEALPIQSEDVPSPKDEVAASNRPASRRLHTRGRRDIGTMDHLPQIERTYELTGELGLCPTCRRQREKIGSEITYTVEYLPASFLLIKHLQCKYACRACDHEGHSPHIELAEKRNASPIDKGLPGPGLLAYIATAKYADFCPLHRLQNIFGRQGFELDRSTMCLWMADVARIVRPIYQRMAQRVRQSHVLATDDTVMPLLQPGRAKQARMWFYLGDESQPYNVFDFSVRGEAVLEMREGLSQSGNRTWLQTSLNCGDKESPWETSGAKGAARPRQVRTGKTNASEPPKRCRENIDDVKTGEVKLPWEQCRRCLFAADVTSGIEAAPVRFGLEHGTSEPVVPMPRETSKRRTREDQSTDAGHRGGTTRSSVEGRVMRSEQRGRVIQLSSNRSTA